MSLFQQLLRLQSRTRGEDFFTLIVAHLLNKHPRLLRDWLASLGIAPPTEGAILRILTQYATRFDSCPVRPDLLIDITEGNERHWIFVESKVGSVEGPGQLKKYAGVPAAETSLDRRTLVYVTRDDEPKDEGEILEGCVPGAVRFVQARWHGFYHVLKAQPPDTLLDETMQFMEMQGMVREIRLATEDAAAMFALKRIFAIMDTVNNDKALLHKLKRLTGLVAQCRGIWDLAHHRYYAGAFSEAERWWMGYGFYFDASVLPEFPTLRLQIEVAPDSRLRGTLIATMKQIAAQGRWQPYGLDEADRWSGIYLERSLAEVLPTEDHIAASKGIFDGLLDALSELKRLHPELPWQEEAPERAPEEPGLAIV